MTDRTELRPAETVAETVPTRHEAPDVAELRRLLDAYRAASGLAPIVDAWYAVARAALAALPALLDAAAERDRLAEAVRAYGRTIDRWGLLIVAATRSEDITTSGGDGDWEVIESRLAEVPALLTERDALAANLAHMTEARDNARAEVERLAAMVERVRELHERESFWQYNRDQEHSYLTQQDAADESGCDCPYAPEPSAELAHTPECLATISHFDVCSECARIEYADADRQAHGEFSGYAEALWPCPTIAAIGG